MGSARISHYNAIRYTPGRSSMLTRKESTEMGNPKRRALASALLAVVMLGLGGSAAKAQQGPQAILELENKIPLGVVHGRIDHLAIDLARKRLFIAELENNTVGSVDLGTGSLLQRITGLKEPQGVGYVPSVDTLFVANAGDGTVRLFRGEDFAPAAHVELGKDADNVRVDADSKWVYVGYGAGGLAVIDPVTRARSKDIALPAHPESFQISRSTRLVFVNLPDAQSIAVIDTDAGRQRESWPTGNDRGNFAMALDDENQRV